MGGFEAEGEGGYWEDDQVAKWKKKHHIQIKHVPTKPQIEKNGDTYSIKAHAKVNIFLKITGYKEGYHTLISRFVRVEDLYDTIAFIPSKCDTFTLEGCDNIPLESNTIYKAYKVLNEHTGDLDILNFFYKHKVVVNKRIPAQSGLGGGSSDAAAFMLLVKEVCNLMIHTDELAKLGSTIGADIPFFIYNYPCANVSGFGEIVEPYNETPLQFELYTPKIKCDTALVYKTFKENLLTKVDTASFLSWNTLDSRKILDMQNNPKILNDLYTAACIAYPELQNETKQGWFFSGSGSTFFRVKE